MQVHGARKDGLGSRHRAESVSEARLFLRTNTAFTFNSGPGAATVTTVGCVSATGGIDSACSDPFTTDSATALASTPLNTGSLSGNGQAITFDACTYTGAQPGDGGYGSSEAQSGTGAGCLSNWANHLSNLENVSGGMGKPPCSGAFCGFVPNQAVNSTWVQYFTDLTVGSGYGTVTMSDPAFAPVDENSTTARFTIVAAINSGASTCVVN